MQVKVGSEVVDGARAKVVVHRLCRVLRFEQVLGYVFHGEPCEAE